MKKIQNILLYLLFFSVAFEMWQPIPGVSWLSIVKVMGALYFASIITQAKGFFIVPRKIRSIYIPLALYYLFLVVMNIANINPVNSAWINAGFLQWTVMLVILVNHEMIRPGSLPRAMLAFAFGCFVLSCFYSLGIGVEVDSEGRVTIFGDNQNPMAMRMAIGSIILINNAIYSHLKQKKIRFVLLFAIIPMIILIVDTGSRVAFLSLVVMLGAMMLLIRIRNTILRATYALMIIAIIGFTVYYTINSEVMSSRLENTIETGNLSGRQEIWAKTILLIRENPIAGVGQTGYDEYCIKAFGELTSPHNVFLELMCYTGIIGTIFYLIFFSSILKVAIITFRRAKNFLPMMLLVGVLAMMLSMQALNVKMVWCIYAYIISSYLSLFRSPSYATRKPGVRNSLIPQHR